MPAAPKSTTGRKTGHPKVKGATRSKSGCITCRLRRKKCDEKKSAEGSCETCVRLKLECLGFSGKRPDYLKSETVVNEMREKIKSHLANLGMIKGHTSGPRHGQADDVLKLRTDGQDGSSPSSSGESPRVRLSSAEPMNQYSLYPISSARGAQPSAAYPPDFPYGAPLPPFYGSPSGSHHSPELSASPPYQDAPVYDHPHNVLPSFGSTLVSEWNYEPIDFTSRATTSGFHGYGTYAGGALEEDADDLIMDGDVASMELYQRPVFYGQRYGYLTDPTFAHEGPHVDSLIRLYMSEVFTLQYLLADVSLRDVLQSSILSNPFVRKAVLYLSSVHHAQTKAITQSDLLIDSNDLYEQLTVTLRSRSQALTEEDAVAALHVVSAFLFQGGKGQWRLWLDTACAAVRELLAGSRYGNAKESLLRFDERLRYIVKTTMWFDVLAAATEQRVPAFIKEYREMFAPPGVFPTSFVEDLEELHPAVNMMGTMGAENHIVWAMAEITDLSVWKEAAYREGRLSIPTLVTRGKQIEDHLQARPIPQCMPGSIDEWRYLTSEIFRASTRVYLQSVLSGDHPHCPEIKEAVDETIACLHGVWSGGQHASRSVVRSVVFSMFITGSLTTDPAHRKYMVARLTEQTMEMSGNCAEVLGLLETVWKEHDASPNLPVPWRRVLRESGMPLLV